MKIMHIADLHIGKTIHQQLLLDDQYYILNEYLKEIDKNNIEIIIIAGDIFDRSNPSKEALQLFEWFMNEINLNRRLYVLIISGNHDGAERLAYGTQWFKQAGIHFSTTIETSSMPVVINGVNFYLVPYIEAPAAKVYYDDDSIRTHHDTYEVIIRDIKKSMNPEEVNVLVSHLFVDGGEETESERMLIMGTIEYVHESIFEGFDYVALGHLHHPFAIKSDFVFYSGSPLKYSFSEANQPKGYRLLNIDPSNKSVESRFIPVKPKRDVVIIKSDYDNAIQDQLTIKNYNDYFRMELKNVFVTDPMTKLRALYPNILELKIVTDEVEKDITSIQVDTMTDLEIMDAFYFDFTDKHLPEDLIERIDVHMKKGDDR